MPDASTSASDGLRQEVRAFLTEASPPSEVRRLMETDLGYDPAVWGEMVARGWPSLPIPELAMVVEEAGAALLCAPLLGTAAARATIAEDWDPAAVVALAVAEDSGRWEAEGVTLRATPSPTGGGEWRLDGHKSFVVDGWVADTLLVAGRATTDGGVGLFLVERDAPGVDHTRLATVDLTRQQTRVELSATPARRVGDEPACDRLLDVAVTLLAAEQVGGARRCLEMTVDHLRRRVQFGRPIGSFQAVQHRCAEMLVDVESARSASAWATATAASPSASADLPQAAATAKVTCSEAYAFVAGETIHLHGALGFTWDHDAHLYFKRAKSSRQLFGDPRFHRQRLFRLLDL